MATRDEIHLWGGNSRLDSLQAVIALRLMKEVETITAQRIANARRFDEAFADLSGAVRVPPRRANVRQVFHTYVIRVESRDALLASLLAKGIRAKVHYPIPLHLQKAAADLGYKAGDFPVCEADCRSILTLPVHQHLTPAELDYTIDCVRGFYGR
jgi:dTDP-4-amino-4,6-dideoxygalactose transaminase